MGLALLLALGATACGDDGGDSAAADDAPQHIVSLSPSATEMLFAVGAGDQVVATDEYSNYPAEAPTTDLSGFKPNVEAILKYEPDLVVLSNDIDDVVAGLEATGVKVLLTPAAATLEDTWQEIEAVGDATGHADEAADLVADLKGRIDDLTAQVPKRAEPLTYYHELGEDLYSVTSSTFIGELYTLAGLSNIADAAGDASGGYPQLSAEFVLDADPDMIFLADTVCCGQSAATVGARPGWETLTAVADGNVVELDDDVASRWGPRVVDLLQQIIDATAKVPA